MRLPACFPIIFLLLLSSIILPMVHANSVVGTVKLTVINRPPLITDITILPKAAYPDAELRCSVSINDEQSDKVSVSYTWMINGVESREKTDVLVGFRAGDNVSCEASPTDVEGLPGDSKNAKIRILVPSTTLKMTKSVLSVFTKNATFEKSAELSADGLSGVTAYVVYENGGVPSLLGLIAVLLGITALLLMTFFLRRRVKS